ncbi:hypothetical protein [Streptomyces sp. NPDC058084]|uniref:hypothetical protein n=1 Tax=Streptomyces sp. NPDC058084 TaxID=3346333 RepID=UPI0036E23FE6
MALGPHGLTTADNRAVLVFLADRIEEMGPAAMADPLVAGLNAQLVVYDGLLEYRDHGAIDSRDAGFIDGVGLALRHTASRWSEHPDFQERWAPPAVPVEQLLMLGDNYRTTAYGAS